MKRTTVFQNNKTQAVRLPKEVALPDDVRAVDIVAVGATRIITPAGGGLDYWLEHGLTVSEDFLRDRDQPEAQERAAL